MPRQIELDYHGSSPEAGKPALVGVVRKMQGRYASPVEYSLPVGEQSLELNGLIGRQLRIEWAGKICCVSCGRAISKSYHQGHCFPCSQKLAACDVCMVRPELCHYHLGTCREPSWGERHCLVPHTVYLANSSRLKVGITSGCDPRRRWIDQGASQGLAIRRVASRLAAGQLEVALAAFIADKTDWRAMLASEPRPRDLSVERDRLLKRLSETRPDFELPGHPLKEAEAVRLEYPVAAYPRKSVAFPLERLTLCDTLTGIKGQYLLFDTCVLNVRKYIGYELAIALVPSPAR